MFVLDAPISNFNANDSINNAQLGSISGARGPQGYRLECSFTGLDKKRTVSSRYTIRSLPAPIQLILVSDVIDLVGANDAVGIFMDNAQEEPYPLLKSVLCTESVYFRSWFSCWLDLRPSTTNRLANMSQNADDRYAFVFIALWLTKCKRIPISAAIEEVSEEPRISLTEWCEGEDQRRLTFLRWAQIYCLAEDLRMERFQGHITTAVCLKVLRQHVLPTIPAIEYLYRHGSRCCRLRDNVVEYYAIAAMEPKDVFEGERNLFPRAFVNEVAAYHCSNHYLRRRQVYIPLSRPERGFEEGI